MLALAIVGVLLSLGLPDIARLLSAHRVAVATNDLVHAIATTRMEAIGRNRRVYLAPLDQHWRDGWAIFVDRNDNRAYDGPDSPAPDDTIVVRSSLPSTITIASTSGIREPFSDNGSPRRPYIAFDGNGFPRQRNGALNFGSFVITDHSAGVLSVRTLCIAAYGRVRVVVDQDHC